MFETILLCCRARPWPLPQRVWIAALEGSRKLSTEVANPCPTPQSVHHLADPEWVCNRFKDDFVLQIMLAHRNAALGDAAAGSRVVMDLMEEHERDFATRSLQPAEYAALYYVGHYNPLGNFFTARAIVDKLLKLLEPPPPAHRFDVHDYWKKK